MTIDSPLRVLLSEPTDFAAAGEGWRALEARADCSFFQTWHWTGCLAERRFFDPVLLQAWWQQRLVAMALFNRHPGPRRTETWHLGESGDAALDAICTEYNGMIFEHGLAAWLLLECLRAALDAPISPGSGRPARRLVMNGVGPAYHAAAKACGAAVRIRQSDRIPVLAFERIDAHRGLAETFSANTRYQLRRSVRCYEADGALRIERARSAQDAQAYLTSLAHLHQESWVRRGKPGAFADPYFLAFHHELIKRAFPSGEVDLLRISAGERIIGYLYNFRFRSRILSYQGGFDYQNAGRHQKPGLTCHLLAMEMYRAEGAAAYDFLAGESRYKSSLTNAITPALSLELVRRWSVPGISLSARNAAERLLGRSDHRGTEFRL